MQTRCRQIGNGSGGAPLHVLLVEDDPGDALLVARSLGVRERPAPFALSRASTLSDGLARLTCGSPDALLLDLHLPDSDDVETLVRVREQDARVPIVVLTSHGDDGTARAALEAGAQDYLVKDEISAPHLARALRHAIERRKLQSARERLERQRMELRQLESLGLLAAEIGRDFHNLLSVIAMNAEAVRAERWPSGPARASVEAICVAAEFGTGLARQLRGAARVRYGTDSTPPLPEA